MLRRSLWAAPALLAFAGPALARPRARRPDADPMPAPQASAPGLIGAWLLVSAETLDPNGQATPAFGGLATGALIYDRSGEMSLQIAGERPTVGSIETFQSLSPRDKTGRRATALRR